MPVWSPWRGRCCSCHSAGTSWSTGSATHSATVSNWAGSCPGIIFVIMGGVPLLGWLAARGHGPVVPGVRSTTTPIELNELASAMRQVSLRASRQRLVHDDRR